MVASPTRAFAMPSSRWARVAGGFQTSGGSV
jgi:hypothetical protein